LQYLHDLRWEDNSLGSNFLLDWGTINQEFAAGNIGMYTSGSDVYFALVRDFSLDPADYGLGVVPVENGGGTLGGGDIAVVSPTVDDTTKAAAVKWIDWYYMQKLLDEDAAVLDAKTLAESDQAVGTPVLPVLDRETYEESLTWIEPYINVPRDQMTPFIEGVWDQTPMGEPKGKTQEIYGLLDTVVQAVLTDQNVDIDALLEKADTDAQALLDE
jgi:ABC-type glycerol-3-phosphate transport system substrate-binding protein